MAATFTCAGCKQAITTAAPPGRTIACKKCGSEARVPLREVVVTKRQVVCAGCGVAHETSIQPGRRTRCPGCDAEVRVPLRDPAEAAERREQAEAEATASATSSPERWRPGHTCQYCEARLKPEQRRCPECGWEPASASLPMLLTDPGRSGGLVLMATGTLGCVGLWLTGVSSMRLHAVAAGIALVGMLAVIAGTARRR